MMIDDSTEKPFKQIPHKKNFLYLPKDSTITFYTIMAVLMAMKRRLGLEAMLEYMESYIGTIERNNTHVKHAVKKVLAVMKVDAMYERAVKENKK